MNTCTYSDCTERNFGHGLCNKHYKQKRKGRLGITREQVPGGKPEGIYHKGYHYIYVTRDHYLIPTTCPNNPIAAHRIELFKYIGLAPTSCHWCGAHVEWFSSMPDHKLQVDHVDFNRLNNHISNLVPACRKCNTNRIHL